MALSHRLGPRVVSRWAREDFIGSRFNWNVFNGETCVGAAFKNKMN